jgi:hypothetical protein
VEISSPVHLHSLDRTVVDLSELVMVLPCYLIWDQKDVWEVEESFFVGNHLPPLSDETAFVHQHLRLHVLESVGRGLVHGFLEQKVTYVEREGEVSDEKKRKDEQHNTDLG